MGITMSLRNQPYIPLYVQDFLTDEKLNECSAASVGVYIKIMCVMHKSDEYGTILLRQKDQQTDWQIKNFAIKLAKHLPFDLQVIEDAIKELTDEKVLTIDGNKMFQKRMVKDNDISEKRSKAGSKGGFAKAKCIAKDIANSENENENENVVVVEEEVKTWKNDFEIYKAESKKAHDKLVNDPSFIKEQARFNPNVDIKLTLEKAYVNYWGTEAGWKKKKASRSNEIDWKRTFINAIGINKVYYQKSESNKPITKLPY